MVAGSSRDVLVVRFILQGVGKFEARNSVHDSLRKPQCLGRTGCEPVGKIVGMLVKLNGWDDLVDEAELFSFFRGYCFSCHDEFEGSSGTDHLCLEIAASRIWDQT